MNQEQINRKEMHDATLNFLAGKEDKWIRIIKVLEFKTALNSVNTKIEAAGKSQAIAQVFVGGNKSELKKTIAQKADILNDSIEVFADLSGDVELAQQMSDSKTDLYKLKNEEFIIRIRLIIEKAIAYINVLMSEYGVQETQITDLQSDFDNFLELNGQPRAYRIASNVATKDLGNLFKEANEILQKLDKVMKIFQRRDANFYNGYLSARVVVDR